MNVRGRRHWFGKSATGSIRLLSSAPALRRKRYKMNKLSFISYALASMACACLVSGLLVLSGGKNDGRTRVRGNSN